MTTAAMQAAKDKVFISYRRADAEIAERLYSLLWERGVDAWYDGLIPSSADWRDAIVEQLGRSRLMVSTRSNGEATPASSRGKTVRQQRGST